MGTNVYKGFRLRTDSFSEALKLVNAFRPWVNSRAEDVLDAFMANAEAAKTNPKADAYSLWLDLREKFVREKQRRVPNIDTDFSVSLIPADGVVLGIVYTEHQAWYDAWCKQSGVEEYAYWGTDVGPEHLSDAEWNARGEAWSAMSYDPVCMQGFSVDLVDPQGPLPKAFR